MCPFGTPKLFFQKTRFIYLSESQSWGETEKDFLLMGSLPQWLQFQVWAKPKPGARSLLWVSHKGAGAQALRPSSSAFPGALAGRWIRSGAARTRTDGAIDSSFSSYTTVPAPILIFQPLLFLLISIELTYPFICITFLCCAVINSFTFFFLVCKIINFST